MMPDSDIFSMEAAANADPNLSSSTPEGSAVLVKIGRSPIRVTLRPPAILPSAARQQAIARAVRAVIQERVRPVD